jgi:hypothetical protein
MPPVLWVALSIFFAVGAALAITILERARRRNLQAADRWATLSRVSAVLAEVLRADTALEDVARLVIPQFADWCTRKSSDASPSLMSIRRSSARSGSGSQRFRSLSKLPAGPQR